MVPNLQVSHINIKWRAKNFERKRGNKVAQLVLSLNQFSNFRPNILLILLLMAS